MSALPPALRAGAGAGCAALLVVPPFSGANRPSLALHLLQACARRAGFEVSIFYANLYLASRIGRVLYEAVSYAPTFWLLGERYFAQAAYGKPALSREAINRLQNREDVEFEIDTDALLACGRLAGRHADEMAAIIADAGYPIAGFSTTFEQTAASIALIDRLKARDAGVVTIIGGANCEGPMANGIRSLSEGIDYVFSGESESSFLSFLASWRAGTLPQERILAGEAVVEMDGLPPPDYQDYYDQLGMFLPEVAASGDVWLPYESSRGCWWGAKHHCTFCGLNAQTMAHRSKSGERVLAELETLLARHPSRKISMVDNIMPREYFRTFLPHAASRLGPLHIFYEEKANLTLEQVLLLKRAGVHVIQPGIESLSTATLKLMNKGVSARKNLQLLRFARVADLSLNWNYLIGFPGDRAADYREVIELIPALVHLNPPSGLSGLSIDRFSPYFERPAEHGVADLQPMPSYLDVLPEGVDAFAVAYHFHADYRSESRQDGALQAALRKAIDQWKDRWRRDDTAAPTLSVTPLDEETYMLLDSRFDPDEPVVEFIDGARMRVVLAGEHSGDTELLRWAQERRYVAKVDGRWVPLGISDPDTLAGALSPGRRGEGAVPAGQVIPILLAPS